MGREVTGFYVVARNQRNEDVAGASFEVWNPNIGYLYQSLRLENPYGVLFSGTGETMTFSFEEIQQAYEDAEHREYYRGAIREALHPIVLIFSGVYPMLIDPDKDREQ